MHRSVVDKLDMEEVGKSLILKRTIIITTNLQGNGVWISKIEELDPYIVGYGATEEEAVKHMLIFLSEMWEYYACVHEDSLTWQANVLRSALLDVFKEVDFE